MGVLAASDRAAGSLARAATTLGQLALVSLGVHLAADRLDDHLVTAILAAQSWLDGALGELLQRGASALGLASDTLLLWELVPVATVAAWAALLVELSAMGVFAMTFLLTNRSPVLSWSRWRDAIGATALVVPAALLGVLLAGSWSMAMAVEDVLPASPASGPVAALVGVAVFLRFGWAAWRRAVSALQPEPRWWVHVGSALLLAPVGGLAWAYGVPVWGLLVRGAEGVMGGLL